MKNNWLVAEKKHENIIDQILDNRGVKLEEKSSFLQPDFQRDLEDSLLMPDFDKFKRRIDEAIAANEKVGIFADYDADGIPGAAFLSRCFDKMGVSNEVYIPSRDEGYGLNKMGIDVLVASGCTLIITVDLGIRNFNEALYCKEISVDLIITDHHLPDDHLPEAIAVINPKVPGSKYPFKDLSGAGVVFKLAHGLSQTIKTIDEKFLKWNLDLIAISTISDVVPLVGENRVIAKYGLMVLQKSRNTGLRALYKVSEINYEKMGAFEVGFMIGPRLNAPGRIADAKKSFKLLTTDDVVEAEQIAYELNRENKLRQDMMEELQKEADNVILTKKLYKNKIIVIKGSWSKGIIGPSASRIAEKYSRPVVLISSEGDKLTGSARSVNDINITELLEKCSEHLEKYGGHKGAAGLSLDKSNYQKLYDKLIEVSNKSISDKELLKIHKADAELSFNDITFSLCKTLKELEPYGMGNPRPTFVTRLAKIHTQKYVGATEKHLSSFIEHQNKKIKSIYFNCPYKKGTITDYSDIDIIYTVDEEFWNGKNYLKIHVSDIEVMEKK